MCKEKSVDPNSAMKKRLSNFDKGKTEKKYTGGFSWVLFTRAGSHWRDKKGGRMGSENNTQLMR